MDNTHGLPYYYNSKTKETSWQIPDGLVIPLAALQKCSLGRSLPASSTSGATEQSSTSAPNTPPRQDIVRFKPLTSPLTSPRRRRQASYSNGQDSTPPTSPSCQSKMTMSPASSFASFQTANDISHKLGHRNKRGPDPLQFHSSNRIDLQLPSPRSQSKLTLMTNGPTVTVDPPNSPKASKSPTVRSFRTLFRSKSKENMGMPTSPTLDVLPSFLRKSSGPGLSVNKSSGTARADSSGPASLSPAKAASKNRPISLPESLSESYLQAIFKAVLMNYYQVNELQQFADSTYVERHFALHRTNFWSRKPVALPSILQWQAVSQQLWL